MKKCFLINAYCDTEEKVQELSNCIDRLGDYNYDIILHSHYPVDSFIQDKVTHTIYDSTNPIIDIEKRSVILYTNIPELNYRLCILHPDYGYTAIQQWIRGLNYVHDYGYEEVFILNYDVEVSNKLMNSAEHSIDTHSNFVLEDNYDSMSLLFSAFNLSTYKLDNLSKLTEKVYLSIIEEKVVENIMYDLVVDEKTTFIIPKNEWRGEIVDNIRFDLRVDQIFKLDNCNIHLGEIKKTTNGELVGTDRNGIFFYNIKNFPLNVVITIGNMKYNYNIYENNILKELPGSKEEINGAVKNGFFSIALNGGIVPDNIIQRMITSSIDHEKEESFCWITGGDENYLDMMMVLADSIEEHSYHSLIVYTYNFDYTPIKKYRKVTFQRINIPKGSEIPDTLSNIRYKDYSSFYGKFYASKDVMGLNYDNYAWLDGDAFVTENIDNITRYVSDIDNYPLFMTYFHEDIHNWRTTNGVHMTAQYGSELSSLFNIHRNPHNQIIATGFYLFNNNCYDFFNECFVVYELCKKQDMFVYVDDNAFSEERVSNLIMWKHNYVKTLPITWINFQNEERNKFTNDELRIFKKGYDIMYNKESNDIMMIHGPQPSINEKNGEYLEQNYRSYNSDVNKLMIVAHPDDETIFGFSELYKTSGWRVICLTNGENPIRKLEFEKIMYKLGVNEYEMLDYIDKLEYGHLKEFSGVIKDIIDSKKWEKIVTHNPVGEYGHPQHKELFDIIYQIKKDIHVFGKSEVKLENEILNSKLNILKTYESEQEIITQLKDRNGDWFLDNSNSNYIEYEDVSMYVPSKENRKYIECFNKTKEFFEV